MTKGFCNSTILYNREMPGGIFRMGISWKAEAVRPGQFVMLKASEGPDPLLRRPFGIYDVIGGSFRSGLFKGHGIEILYKVVGRGTGILSMRKPGESVDVLGPLGNGFPSISQKNKKIIFVAGGMGIAPLNLLAKTLTTPYLPLVKGGIGGGSSLARGTRLSPPSQKHLKGLTVRSRSRQRTAALAEKALLPGF